MCSWNRRLNVSKILLSDWAKKIGSTLNMHTQVFEYADLWILWALETVGLNCACFLLWCIAMSSDSKKCALKWEYDYKRSEEERETMEMSIEKLRNDMAKSDAKKKQLLEQVWRSSVIFIGWYSIHYVGAYFIKNTLCGCLFDKEYILLVLIW